MRSSKAVVILLRVLLHVLVSSLAAGADNFLHSGCRISTSLRDVFADSLSILVKYSSKEDFRLTVDQNGKQHSLRLRGMETNHRPESWTHMELDMNGKLELLLQNGSAWRTEDVVDVTVDQIPEKTVLVSHGYLLPDCPQEMPNWKVAKDLTLEHVIVDEGDEIVFSFITTEPTNMTFDVGNENLVLCWSDVKSSMVVVQLGSSRSSCTNLPSHTVLWMQVVLKSQMIHISEPADPSVILRSFHMQGNSPRITFKDENVNGIVYVVHHLLGFPPPTVQEPDQVDHYGHNHKQLKHRHAAKPTETNMCVWVSSVVGAIITLVLVIFVLLSALFYNRWMTARQVLLLLQTQDLSSHRSTNEIIRKKTNKKDNNYGELPPFPPPSPNPSATMATDTTYLTPRQFKSLRAGGAEDKRKSEHIYEDLTKVFDWSKKGGNKSGGGGPPKENLAFDSTLRVDDKKKKKVTGDSLESLDPSC